MVHHTPSDFVGRHQVKLINQLVFLFIALTPKLMIIGKRLEPPPLLLLLQRTHSGKQINLEVSPARRRAQLCSMVVRGLLQRGGFGGSRRLNGRWVGDAEVSGKEEGPFCNN